MARAAGEHVGADSHLAFEKFLLAVSAGRLSVIEVTQVVTQEEDIQRYRRLEQQKKTKSQLWCILCIYICTKMFRWFDVYFIEGKRRKETCVEVKKRALLACTYELGEY